MAFVTGSKGSFSVKAWQGDFKTLLAFNFATKAGATNLTGFTIQCAPQGLAAYYLQNDLRFQTPGTHAQDPQEPANSTVNAPIQKFRWLHVPGSVHQGADPVAGAYTYTVTPRYFDAKGSMLPIDTTLSALVKVNVGPFQKMGVELGFTRGFTQSQAFTDHFGLNALIRPTGNALIFDTSQKSGTNSAGQAYTFAEEYEWMGFTAREKIFDLLNGVVADSTLHLDVFAYDLNEPDVMNIFLKLAAQGRMRIILDNSSLHHNAKSALPEDQFAALFTKAAKGASAILRGKFGRYSHDKVFIVSKAGAALKVLTGSTNFSVTGMYVNSNHVLIFSDTAVAAEYQQVFNEAWQDKASKPVFSATPLASKWFPFASAQTPQTQIAFAPHPNAFALSELQSVATRITQEATKGKTIGSVLFAVMQIDQGTSPVYTALMNIHKNAKIFSYGISDSPGGIYFYPVGQTTGVLVTGKPINTQLPPPFNQVRNITGVGHQIHHKFVVCDFNGDSPVVYCGSSNMAVGGEELNGDNLLAIHDGDIATVFAIEALALVDHFNFLDHVASGPTAKKVKAPGPSKRQDAVSAGWFLAATGAWAQVYFNPKDLHSVDRQLFGN